MISTCLSNLTPTRFSPFQFACVSLFVSCLTPDDMFVPGSPFPLKFNSLFALSTLPYLLPTPLCAFVAPCRLPVRAHGEGREPGHHSDSDMGAQLPHPEAGRGGAALHHTRELPGAQERTPPRAKVAKSSHCFVLDLMHRKSDNSVINNSDISK